MNLRAKSKNFVLIILMLFVNNQFFNAQKSKNAENEEFVTGADQPEKYLPLLKGKSVGVVTNQTGLVTIPAAAKREIRGSGDQSDRTGDHQ